jgi:hypothetical protein
MDNTIKMTEINIKNNVYCSYFPFTINKTYKKKLK